ncbi:FtsL-like putative cell division protein [Wenyingzhuangia sp. chi5]|uniref:FtsL-like putative cell division protein n=1 Tax=Wenyingzhuangia gilva TaxID=3057677 RepID=A0ABT8VPB7_9FLAO|nr:FtsL-like putative cell division protein [Wenyingzhuangia sp. chi5]MDO3693797.1 FtsL-like putative cell division protein [Wenyingzhuangia sp. chi5]
MVGVGEFISGVLKGDFLIKSDSVKNWKVIFVVLGMSIIMITCAHQTDEKNIKISVLNKEIRALKAEYIDSATKVVHLKLESTVKDQVAQEGLKSSVEPPIKIVVKKPK